MVTLAGLMRTLRLARQPYIVIPLKFSNKRKSVTFRNGSTFRLTWPEFRILRDNYSLIQEHAVEQLEDGVFKIRIDKSELVGSLGMLVTFRELKSGEYDCGCLGKVVLDVGGFQGESAVLFSRMGASKVIIYEPVVAHHRFIRENVSLNHINAEIHEEGIGTEDGAKTISYDKTDETFGFPAKGKNEMTIKIRAVARVIAESGASVAKFDCEGAEESLIHVPSKILKRIELYIIEVHSPETKWAIIKKFKASGFSLVKEMMKSTQVSVIFLRQNH